MKSDTLLHYESMDILVKYLGKVEAEKFISLIIREPFDYTKWQNDLWSDKTVNEISQKAMEFRDLNK